MRYASLLTIVERAAGLDPPAAERATEATLRTLAERISGGEAEDIALFLPTEMRPWMLSSPGKAEPFDRREFVRRVAERERVDPGSAEEHIRAVFRMLGFAVAPAELRDMAAQLPKDFGDWLDDAGLGRSEGMATDDLVGRVAELLDSDRGTAQSAVKVVLYLLGVRISAGEVEDFATELPGDVRDWLERGVAAHRAAKPMSEQEFVARVAEREGVTPQEAERHAHAVFQALREAIDPKEFSDMAAQLSRDYAPLLA